MHESAKNIISNIRSVSSDARRDTHFFGENVDIFLIKIRQEIHDVGRWN